MKVEVRGKTSFDPALVELWAKRLGLAEWHITLEDDQVRSKKASEEGSETHAEASILAAYREASIAAGPEFPEDEEERELTVIHELCHLMLADLARAAEVAVEAAPRAARESLNLSAEDAEEITVVRLSRVLQDLWRTVPVSPKAAKAKRRPKAA